MRKRRALATQQSLHGSQVLLAATAGVVVVALVVTTPVVQQELHVE
jgi:hypothetical protein